MKISSIASLLALSILCLSSFNTSTGADKPKLKPVAGKQGELFNGKDLAGWHVANKIDFKKHGKIEVKQNEIVIGCGKPASGIAWQGEPPRIDYEISLDAKRIEGSDFFCALTFPVNKQHCTLIIGGWGGGVTGLSNLDNQSAVDNNTTGYTDFEKNRWYRIRLRVSKTSIEAWIDKEQIVDVETKNHKFSVWWEQEPMRPLGIATWNTKAALRDMRLRKIKPPQNKSTK